MKLRNLENAIRDSRHIVCLLGLSVATDCGCFDYRDRDSSYDVEERYGYSPEEIFSAAFLNTRTKQFFDYYREEILGKLGEPGPDLLTLKKMEDDGKVRAVITRSIYGLPQRAGIKHVVAMHGSVYNYHCAHCGRTYTIDHILKTKGIPLCQSCENPIRPDIVLDGEMIPNHLITEAAGEVERADTLLVLGCTMKATLTQTCIKYFEGSRIILINEEEDYSDNAADLVYHGKPRDVLPKIYR
jgi:NAD-dependent deacetylase